MEQVEVEITGQAITAQYGTLSAGDILRTTPEFAKHLVEDCAAAKYRNRIALHTEKLDESAPPAAATTKPAKAKK